MELQTILNAVENACSSLVDKIDSYLEPKKSVVDGLVSDFFEYHIKDDGTITQTDVMKFVHNVIREMKDNAVDSIENALWDLPNEIEDNLQHARNIEYCYAALESKKG